MKKWRVDDSTIRGSLWFFYVLTKYIDYPVTMRKSKRIFKRNPRYATVPSQNKRFKSTTEPPSESHSSSSGIDGELKTILRQWFNRMLPHVWYKILPSSEDDVNNIAFAMGQPWDILSQVLIHLKLLVKCY